MQNKHMYHFQRESYGHAHYSTTQHTYVCEADSPWYPLILQFSAFLDECGYVGVYEKMSIMLEDEGFQ